MRFLASVAITLALGGCWAGVEKERGGGIAVGNPGEMTARVATSDDIEITKATLVGSIEIDNCAGDTATLFEGELDLLDSKSLQAPHEIRSCGLLLDGGLLLEADGAALESHLVVNLDLPLIALTDGDGVVFRAKESYVLEIGGPDWLDPIQLGMEGFSTIEVEFDKPQHELLIEKIRARSTVFRDRNNDGEISESERSASSLSGASTAPLLSVVGWDGRRAMSDDAGVTWHHDYSVNSSEYLSRVEYLNDQFIAVGGEFTGIAASTITGEEWTTVSWISAKVTDIAWGGGRYIAVGEEDLRMWSKDGYEWIEESPDDAKVWAGITYLADNERTFPQIGRFVAVSQTNNSAVTTDGGESWQFGTLGTDPIWDVASGNGVFIAVGDNMTIYRSTDGLVWDEVYNGGISPIRSVLFDGSRFIAAGSGTVGTSVDGDNWDVVGAQDLKRITHSEGGAYFGIDQDSGVYRSDDALNWEFLWSADAPDLNAIAAMPGVP